MATNRIWLLEPVNMRDGDTAKPWKPWYDTSMGMVVLAASASEARECADRWGQGEENNTRSHPWLHEKFTSCEPVDMAGTSGIILESIREA